MTELETRLIALLEQEKADRQKEMNALADMLEEQSKQNQQIIDLLSKESKEESLSEQLETVLQQFQTNLTTALDISLKKYLEE